MVYLLLSLLLLGVVAAIASRFSHDEDRPSINGNASSCATCNGFDTRCEQECMLEAAVNPIEYYDDEELDSYRGRAADSYTDAEVEEFSRVMYTMRPDEVKGWLRSLSLRGVNLPEALKDEALMLAEG